MRVKLEHSSSILIEVGSEGMNNTNESKIGNILTYVWLEKTMALYVGFEKLKLMGYIYLSEWLQTISVIHREFPV
jgi:hypothetical protein